MPSRQIGKYLKVLVAGLALAAGQAGAVTINFIELANEGGIHLTGVAFNGNPIDVTKPNSETFHISSPSVPTGYSPDAILQRIGISQSSAGFLVNILEFAGGPISDQVWVHQFIPQFTVIDFISDPDQFVTGVAPFATVIETPNQLQNVLNYTNDRGETVTINILSDGDVPEPGSIALVGLGLAGLGLSRRRARKQI